MLNPLLHPSSHTHTFFCFHRRRHPRRNLFCALCETQHFSNGNGGDIDDDDDDAGVRCARFEFDDGLYSIYVQITNSSAPKIHARFLLSGLKVTFL